MPYPTPPGKRIAYDLDGTAVLAQATDTGEWLDAAPAAVTALNSEHQSAAFNQPRFRREGNINLPVDLVLIFPQPMRIRGVFTQTVAAFVSGGGSNWNLHNRPAVAFSKDSTNGIDGTFAPVLTSMNLPTMAPDPSARSTDFVTGIPTTDFVGVDFGEFYRMLDSGNGYGIATVGGSVARQVSAIKVSIPFSSFTAVSSGRAVVHVYGEPDTNSSIDRLEFWSSDSDLPLPEIALGWGDVPLGSTADMAFRIKNQSSTKTATAILVDAVPAASAILPSPDTFLLFSYDAGSSWTPSFNIAAISPGAISGEILIRRTVPLGATLSTWSPRVIAEVGSWV